MSDLDEAIQRIERQREELRRTATSWKIGYSREEWAQDAVFIQVLEELHALRHERHPGTQVSAVLPTWAFGLDMADLWEPSTKGA